MAKAIVLLSVNAGSSSVKATLFQADADGAEEQLARIAAAEVSGLSAPPAEFSYLRGDEKHKHQFPSSISTHHDAFQYILESFFNDRDLRAVSGKDQVDYVCHRIVHGGDYKEHQLITDETYGKIEELEDLAPLHNASAVAIIQSCMKQLPNVKNVACFDSAFHQSMPDYVQTYAISQTVAQKKGLRKYGFHGISYAYITRTVAAHFQKRPSDLNIIALHLGSGASACAIKNGLSIDTSMGLTPLSGLPGGSRSGDIDPCLIFHYTSSASKMSSSSTADLHISQAEEILNKESGWKGLTGTTDFSKIADPNAPESHKLAFSIFLDRIVGYVGSYFVKLDGKVDALVFSGGIGERSVRLREMVIQKCSSLGFVLDRQRNDNPDQARVVEIGQGSNSNTLICRTDEELEMAYSCLKMKF